MLLFVLACVPSSYSLHTLLSLFQRSLVPTMLCAVVGSQCSRVHTVPVPIDRGYESAPRPIDLDCSNYLEFYDAHLQFPCDMDDYMFKLTDHAAPLSPLPWLPFERNVCFGRITCPLFHPTS